MAMGGEAKWQASRLIPVTGITGPPEQERRGTSVFLAVLSAVREFGRAVTTRMGAPAGPISTFIECEFPQDGNRTCRPDGLIRVRGRGDRIWTALVEVKTQRNTLDTDQVETYLDVARDNDFDAVVTVSTELADIPGGVPFNVDKRKLRKVSLHHLSWSEIHTEALLERDNHTVSDPDQAWILSEFIRYMESPKSGTLEFDDMGPAWVAAREAAARNTLREADAREVVARFGQLVAYTGMVLSQRLGVVVRPALNRRDLEQAAVRAERQVAELVKSGRLAGALAVPNAIGPLQVAADLRANRVECSVRVDAPQGSRPLTRVNWLLRQLSDPPADLMIQALAPRSRGRGPSCRFDKARDDPSTLVEQPKVDIREFVLSVNRPAGTKRGRGRGSFIDSVLGVVQDFYERAVQDVKPVVPAPPKVRGDGSSTDGPVASTADALALAAAEPPPPGRSEDDDGDGVVGPDGGGVGLDVETLGT